MNKVVKTRAHLMSAKLQLLAHNNHTSQFLKRENNCRSDLGNYWKGKRESPRAKRRLIQSISLSFQFPCAANFRRWGWQESEECRLCKALYSDVPAFSECLGHLQCHCIALQQPRIAVHHGIRGDLLMHIQTWSREECEDDSRVWTFISEYHQPR